MNTIIEEMASVYHPQTIYEKKNVMKEIMQEIVLCGLSRAGFFKNAAFYGGTALRIFYGLDRFSEDLDFSLMQSQPEYSMEEYFPVLVKEIKSFGLNVQIEKKEKVKDSQIRSAFLKGNTKEHLLLFYPEQKEIAQVAANEVVKIKFEIDVNPPNYAGFEKKYRLRPVPYEVTMYDEPSLFAGKIHAVLARSWKNRVKGRDLYDYVFYLTKGIDVNLQHLKARLVQSGHIKEETKFTVSVLKQMLDERFAKINYEQAKADVAPFIKDASLLNLWSNDFFMQITKNLQST